MHLADVGGAGPKSLLVANDVTPGLFPRSDIDGSWGPFTPFEQWPNAAFGDANLRQIDLNCDGEPDLVIARDDCFVWYPSLGPKGYGAPHIVPMAGDEARGARLVFADAESTIFIGDMSGDGLADIVRIRNGEIAYWPNLGYGRFGAKITMGNSPASTRRISSKPHACASRTSTARGRWT